MALILFYLWMEWPQRLADKIRKGVTDWMVNKCRSTVAHLKKNIEQRG